MVSPFGLGHPEPSNQPSRSQHQHTETLSNGETSSAA
jgi:hypothetical protein